MHAPHWHRPHWPDVDVSLGVAILAVVAIFVVGYVCAVINAVRG